jgi:hypothetical protein
MFSKHFAAGLLAIACVTAAAGGAYVAVRQNESPREAAAPAASAPAVQETEAVVAPDTPAPALSTRAAAAELVEQPRAREVQRPVEAARVERPSTPRPANRSEVRRTAPVAEPPSPQRSASSAPGTRPVDPVPAATETPSFPPEPATRVDTLPAPASVEPIKAEAPAPEPRYEEVVVPAAVVMGLRIETAVTSERAQVEDRVEARVTRDVSADGRPAIPAGSRVIGAVTLVERGGKVKERAKLGVRFHTLVLADGTELPIRTEAILREGDSPAGESGRKIGGAAVGGAILGAIMGGKKGAIVGGATGAAGGTAVVMAGDRNAATLPVGTVVTVRLSAPLTIVRGPVQ